MDVSQVEQRQDLQPVLPSMEEFIAEQDSTKEEESIIEKTPAEISEELAEFKEQISTLQGEANELKKLSHLMLQERAFLTALIKKVKKDCSDPIFVASDSKLAPIVVRSMQSYALNLMHDIKDNSPYCVTISAPDCLTMVHTVKMHWGIPEFDTEKGMYKSPEGVHEVDVGPFVVEGSVPQFPGMVVFKDKCICIGDAKSYITKFVDKRIEKIKSKTKKAQHRK